MVADQVRLWQADTQRVRPVSAAMYDDFETAELFRAARSHARSLGAWLWDQPPAAASAASATDDDGPLRRNTRRNGCLVVRAESYDAMKAFIKKAKEQM